MRFLQLPGALVTAHLNRLAADLDLDWIPIKLAVASRTCGFKHDVSLLEYPKFGCDQWATQEERAAVRIFSDL